MGNAAAILQILRGINMALAVAQSMRISLSGLQQAMDQASAEGRKVQLRDLRDLAEASDEARAGLQAAIDHYGEHLE